MSKGAGAGSTTVVEFGRHRGSKRVRLEATDWIDAGIQLLVRESIEHVKVDRLAAQLGVTKGSFYWHFKDRADLHAAILDRWLQKATLGVMERVSREFVTPGKKLMKLFDMPFWSPRAARAADLELAIRAWARRSSLARRAVSKVDSMRLEYLTGLYQELGFDQQDATRHAHLAYAFMRYLGQMHDVSEADERSLIQAGYECLVAHAPVAQNLGKKQTRANKRNGRQPRA